MSGLWPVFDLPSFMAVTGPKTDYWLVRTVGALLAVIGVTLLIASRRRDAIPSEIRFLGAFIPLALAVVDIVYVTVDVIAPIYLADAAVELVIAGLWWCVGRGHGGSAAAG